MPLEDIRSDKVPAEVHCSAHLRLAEAAPGLLDQPAAWPERQTQLCAGLRLAEAAPGLLDQSAAWPERQTQLLETLFTDERQLDDADALLGEGGVVLLKQGFNASTRTCSVEY